jgi:SnoaL-like domain
VTATRVPTPSLQAFLDAFNAHDVDAIMSFFTEDCVFDAPHGPAPGGPPPDSLTRRSGTIDSAPKIGAAEGLLSTLIYEPGRHDAGAAYRRAAAPPSATATCAHEDRVVHAAWRRGGVDGRQSPRPPRSPHPLAHVAPAPPMSSVLLHEASNIGTEVDEALDKLRSVATGVYHEDPQRLRGRGRAAVGLAARGDPDRARGRMGAPSRR